MDDGLPRHDATDDEIIAYARPRSKGLSYMVELQELTSPDQPDLARVDFRADMKHKVTRFRAGDRFEGLKS